MRTEAAMPQLCHTLLIRSPEAVDGCWVADVPAASDDPRAERRRAAELAHPTADFRRVLLRYADGVVDLVVVASRSRYDAEALARIAAGLPVVPRDLPLGGPWSTVDWGLPEGVGFGVHVVPAVDLGSRASWRRAWETTLRRYSPDLPDGVGGLLWTGVGLPGSYTPCTAPVFPLTFSVFRDADGVRLRCDHARSHVSDAIAAQITRHLARAHERPDSDPWDAAERSRVLALGRTPAPDTPPDTVTGVFARVVAARPDAVALTDGDESLTYAQLDARSTALAAGLRARGAVGGDRVGVCLPRSAEFVVTALAVLKAGAVYVPLDPAYPAERLAFLAADAGPAALVTAEDGVTPLSGTASWPPPAPDDAAYVIYTSGSTGRPKGVVVPHRCVIALLDATRDEYGLGGDDVWTWFHSGSFDFSVWEIWGCLLTGGRLVVVPHEVSREPERFRDLLVSQRVSVLSHTPSAFTQLLDVDHSGVTARLVVFGGERLDARLLLPWLDRHPGSRPVNLFGITETTVHVTALTVTRAHALAATRSVGRPLPGWEVRVVDEAGELVPPGVSGELVVGGVGVAQGYLHRPELTAERFPHTDTGVVYRSGDRGRLRPDGEVEHWGRVDDQVKLRGFRIEPDEIRAVLLEDDAVRAAAVVLRQDDPDDPATARLAAYVMPASCDPRAIRNRLVTVLPEHLVPATVTALAELPLTPNGKLDLARLPAPTAPAAPVEGDDLATRLRSIWSGVLGTAVDLDDDFFELGGNSLVAVRIGAAMKAADLPRVPLRELYRNPTIRRLLAALSTPAS
ncbi:non-ribosomal peptide synthetase [Actinosynnema sp. NPDC020468]|uniref:non-ribosomal peptide synthetase n=1 Tax=Actinosynnema sp. NPDC020468 TaxID=3154488 RepID=UPI0033DD0065